MTTDSRLARLATALVQLEDLERGIGSSQSGVDSAVDDARRVRLEVVGRRSSSSSSYWYVESSSVDQS